MKYFYLVTARGAEEQTERETFLLVMSHLIVLTGAVMTRSTLFLCVCNFVCVCVFCAASFAILVLITELSSTKNVNTLIFTKSVSNLSLF